MISDNYNRRKFLKTSGTAVAGIFLAPQLIKATGKPTRKIGIQLYTLRKEMMADATGTLKLLAKMGYNEIESAKSEKGNYYGLKPKEIKSITTDLGISLISWHVRIDADWQQSVDEAAEAGQPYLICSVLPENGQTVANYQRSGDVFLKAAEVCKKSGITFGYHNHSSEFEKDGQQTLYDVLLDHTDPDLVKMELDLGWVIAAGADPQYYFNKYPGRFPLWHLKDMDAKTKQSTEFGKGNVNINGLFDHVKQSGLKHFFVEQEEYSSSALESCRYDLDYLKKLKYFN
ncbi:sugar phosphate isomerase/epimerase family protein [Mucilaginibacter ginsenosidivorax]|uniref:Sugar phosphate isomerase/epimerase n=1 Tax=Mucilaginibacter ginsenosidivorax TaxID=862126 RepID=A0A5B8W3E0_9SPHI|nr:sugar phosphate isomerase/epimerase [Mucilaginibacter ginsenosidivorax]QEC78580.1 sugar phosphate isomerase/epimerase [Mucilaginibacter ginsenosidivorax]